MNAPNYRTHVSFVFMRSNDCRHGAGDKHFRYKIECNYTLKKRNERTGEKERGEVQTNFIISYHILITKFTYDLLIVAFCTIQFVHT